MHFVLSMTLGVKALCPLYFTVCRRENLARLALKQVLAQGRTNGVGVGVWLDAADTRGGLEMYQK